MNQLDPHYRSKPNQTNPLLLLSRFPPTKPGRRPPATALPAPHRTAALLLSPNPALLSSPPTPRCSPLLSPNPVPAPTAAAPTLSPSRTGQPAPRSPPPRRRPRAGPPPQPRSGRVGFRGGPPTYCSRGHGPFLRASEDLAPGHGDRAGRRCSTGSTSRTPPTAKVSSRCASSPQSRAGPCASSRLPRLCSGPAVLASTTWKIVHRGCPASCSTSALSSPSAGQDGVRLLLTILTTS